MDGVRRRGRGDAPRRRPSLAAADAIGTEEGAPRRDPRGDAADDGDSRAGSRARAVVHDRGARPGRCRQDRGGDGGGAGARRRARARHRAPTPLEPRTRRSRRGDSAVRGALLSRGQAGALPGFSRLRRGATSRRVGANRRGATVRRGATQLCRDGRLGDDRRRRRVGAHVSPWRRRRRRRRAPRRRDRLSLHRRGTTRLGERVDRRAPRRPRRRQAGAVLRPSMRREGRDVARVRASVSRGVFRSIRSLRVDEARRLRRDAPAPTPAPGDAPGAHSRRAGGAAADDQSPGERGGGERGGGGEGGGGDRGASPAPRDDGCGVRGRVVSARVGPGGLGRAPGPRGGGGGGVAGGGGVDWRIDWRRRRRRRRRGRRRDTRGAHARDKRALRLPRRADPRARAQSGRRAVEGYIPGQAPDLSRRRGFRGVGHRERRGCVRGRGGVGGGGVEAGGRRRGRGGRG